MSAAPQYGTHILPRTPSRSKWSNDELHVWYYEGMTKKTVTEMMKKIDWGTLERRRSNARLCHFFKQANGLICGESEQLQPLDHNCNTKYSENSYKLPHCSCDYYKYSFYPRTIREWNNLPSRISNSTSVKSFKQAILTVIN